MSKFSLNLFKFFCALSFCTTGMVMAVCPPPGITISGTPAFESQVGIANDGTAIAVWVDFDGTNARIQSASLIKGESWSTPVTITTFVDFVLIPISPQIAVSKITGNAVAIWEQRDSMTGNSSIFASVRPADTGNWTSPVQVDTGTITTNSVRRQQIDINTVGLNDDYAVAIWQTNNLSNVFLQSARLHILGFNPGSWSSPPDEVIPATSENLVSPNIVVDTTGIAYAIWQNNTNPLSIQTATLPLDGSVWSPPTTLSPGIVGELYAQPEIALGSTGFLAATWIQLTAANIFFVQATTFQAGSWDLTPDTISNGANSIDELDMDVDLNNNVVAIWREGLSNRTIISAYRPFSTGIWGSPLQVSMSSIDAIQPDVALIAGTAYSVWSSQPSVLDPPRIEFSSSTNGSAWSTPCTNLSPSGEDAYPGHIAVDPTGYSVIVWDKNTGNVIQATFFAPPPTVTSVNPTEGSTSGQNTVLITGTNFVDVLSVEFGAGNPAPNNFIVISATQILAVAPPSNPLGTPGIIDVIVTTAFGTSPLNPPDDQYTYENPICWQR